MKDSVLDILIHLFENFLDAEDDSTPDRDALKTELEQAGYPEAEIERALLWLESLATDPDRALGEGTARAVRVFSGSEQIRLDTDVRGYLLHLENLGILSAAAARGGDRPAAGARGRRHRHRAAQVGCLDGAFQPAGPGKRLPADGRPGLRRAPGRHALNAAARVRPESRGRARGFSVSGDLALNLET